MSLTLSPSTTLPPLNKTSRYLYLGMWLMQHSSQLGWVLTEMLRLTQKRQVPPKRITFYQFTGKPAGTAQMCTELRFHRPCDALPVWLVNHFPLLLHPFAPLDAASCWKETSTAPDKSRNVSATLLKFLPQC